MKKVYIESDKGNMIKNKVDYGVLFSTVDKEMFMSVIGESTFDELNDTIYSGLYHLYESAVHNLGEEKNEKVIREQVYKRAVQMFSLLMDKFYPEGKDEKYGILTDEDIAKAEEAKLDSLSKQK